MGRGLARCGILGCPREMMGVPALHYGICIRSLYNERLNAHWLADSECQYTKLTSCTFTILATQYCTRAFNFRMRTSCVSGCMC